MWLMRHMAMLAASLKHILNSLIYAVAIVGVVCSMV
jgi:hypothetical protein